MLCEVLLFSGEIKTRGDGEGKLLAFLAIRKSIERHDNRYNYL
jgi:hypothetical protein